MLAVTQSPQFDQDIKSLKKKHRDMSALKAIIDLLAEEQPIPAKHMDHALLGKWQGSRELHITWKPDWLLIYEINDNELLLLRTGSHDDLFR